jgi:hypothetical protein
MCVLCATSVCDLHICVCVVYRRHAQTKAVRARGLCLYCLFYACILQAERGSNDSGDVSWVMRGLAIYVCVVFLCLCYWRVHVRTAVSNF